MPRSFGPGLPRGLLLVASCLALVGCAAPAATAPPTEPPATSAPSAGPVEGGAITLTDDGCTWDGNPGTVAASRINLDVRNETDDYGVFIIHRLKSEFSWQDGVDAIDAIQAAMDAGEDWPEWAVNVSTIEGEGAADAGATGAAVIPAKAGTYGVVCSANTSPTGDVLSVFLTGPLELTAP